MKFYAQINPIHIEAATKMLKMSPEQTVLFRQCVTSFKPTDVVVAELKKYRQSRSRRQLGAWWGLFCKVVLTEFEDRGYDTSYIFRLEQPTGIAVTSNLLKDFMYAMCPAYNDKGERITMRDMDTLQMASWFDDCRNFASSQWSIHVPEPDKNWRQKKQDQ